MKRNYLPILTLIALFMVTSLACSLSIANPTSIPTPTPTPIPVSTEAAGEFINSIEQPTIDSTAGTATFVLTEAEITSYVAEQLQADPNPVIRDPQVILENNQVVINGTIVSAGLSAPGSLSATITVGEDGLPKANINSATVGAFPIPSPLLSTISGLIDRGITQNVNLSSTDYRIESITIANHTMTIQLKKK